MFFGFGSPEQVAQLYCEATKGLSGPMHPSVHYEELPEPQVKDAMVYAYIALSDALKDEAEPGAIEILQKQYEDIFLYLASISEVFAQKVVDHKIQYPGGPAKSKYYRDLVMNQRSAN